MNKVLIKNWKILLKTRVNNYSEGRNFPNMKEHLNYLLYKIWSDSR